MSFKQQSHTPQSTQIRQINNEFVMKMRYVASASGMSPARQQNRHISMYSAPPVFFQQHPAPPPLSPPVSLGENLFDLFSKGDEQMFHRNQQTQSILLQFQQNEQRQLAQLSRFCKQHH